jgi:hypothetical protein
MSVEAVEERGNSQPFGEGVAAPTTLSAAPKAGRMANIDRLRLLALMEIVVFHTTGSHIFGGLGLPTFLLFTVALNARPRPSENGAGFAKRKAAMFLIPWAAWSVVYAVVQTAAPLARGADPFKWFEPQMLLVGTQTHLWYLIFALFASLAAFAGYRLTRHIGDTAVVAGGAALSCLVMIPEHYLHVTESWAADWLLAVPAIPLGLALGRCVHTADARLRQKRTLMLITIVVPGMAILEWLQIGYSAWRFALAIVPIAVAVTWPGRRDPVTTRLTGMRLGVYLSHMLIIGALHFVGAEAQHPALRSAAVVVGSFALTWMIMLTPLRWMVQPNALRANGTS